MIELPEAFALAGEINGTLKGKRISAVTAAPACRKPIKKESYMGGSIYYCGTCQRL